MYLAVPVTEDDCGEDLDRAIRGALVGAGGGYLLSGMITGFARHTLYIGMAGAVAGFFGGLETDLQACRRAPE
jgi:hypothetical protein